MNLVYVEGCQTDLWRTALPTLPKGQLCGDPGPEVGSEVDARFLIDG